MNVSRILERLYLGSAPESVDDIDYLWDIGITDIIDCRAEADDSALLDGPTSNWTNHYLHDGVPDWTPEAALGKQPLPFEFFDRALEWAWPLLFEPTPRVYVHCSLGMNRSVTLVYFFLRVLGLNADDAIEVINKHRIETLPWFDLMDSPWRDDAEAALKLMGYA